MKLDPTNKTHRIVILLMIAVPMFAISSVIIWTADKSVEEKTAAEQVQEKEEEESALQPPEKGDHFSPENTNTMTEEEKQAAKAISVNENEVTKETEQETKKIAEQFAVAYQTYNAEKPEEQFEAIQPFIGSQMRSDWEESPPRWPMTITETKALGFETYPVDGGSNYEMAWNVVVQVENTNYTGEKSNTEEWLWIYLTKGEDGWKVQRMDITNG